MDPKDYPHKLIQEIIKESNAIEDIFVGPGSSEFDDHLNTFNRMFDHANGKEPLSEFELLRWHKTLMRNLLDNAGRYRKVGVRVGSYVAPRAELVPGLMEKIPPTANAVVNEIDCWSAHNAFETIHPFDDGNGRTGRLLLNWCRIRLGLQPIVVRSVDKEAYYNKIIEWREHHWPIEKKGE
jgi:Fic family protein